MSSKLAIEGGIPIRPVMLPYAKEIVDDDDCKSVEDVLRSDWLTRTRRDCGGAALTLRANGLRIRCNAIAEDGSV